MPLLLNQEEYGDSYLAKIVNGSFNRNKESHKISSRSNSGSNNEPSDATVSIKKGRNAKVHAEELSSSSASSRRESEPSKK